MKRRKYNRWRLLWTESRFSKGWRIIREKTQVLRRGLILIAILIRVNSWSLDSKENSKFPFILLLNVALKHLKWKKKYLENQRQDNRVLYGRVYCQWGPFWTRRPTKKAIQSKGPLMIFMAQSVLVLAIQRKIWTFRLIVDLIFLLVGRAHTSQRPKRRSLSGFP